MCPRKNKSFSGIVKNKKKHRHRFVFDGGGIIHYEREKNTILW